MTEETSLVPFEISPESDRDYIKINIMNTNKANHRLVHDVIVSIRMAKDCSQTPVSLLQQVTFIVRNSLLTEMLSRRILIRH